MKKYYIAFSIHDSGVFIVATKTFDSFFEVTRDFPDPETIVPMTSRMGPVEKKSRRLDLEDSKLHWSGLNKRRKKNGTHKSYLGPHTHPSHIVKMFNILKRRGWAINDTKFRERWFVNKKKK